MSANDLKEVAQAMVAPGKGLLAADESTGTATKRFDQVGIESTETSRRDWRELLLTAPGAAEYISGVILYDETIRQESSDGLKFPEMIEKVGIIPGIKVDTSTHPLPFAPGEQITEGLDGLRERIAEYVDMGAKFAKWRAVIAIGDGIPSRLCINANAHALARYAALCQEGGLVPIVEPEVLIDGEHSIDQSFEVTDLTLRTVFENLFEHRIDFEGMILKPSMVISGKGAENRAGVEEVAEQTLRVLYRNVPAAVPGICFLSGGQSAEEATAHLDAMNKMEPNPPWQISFSYARALQGTPMEIWDGEAANKEKAQGAFLFRAKLVSAARKGEYSPDMEQEAA